MDTMLIVDGVITQVWRNTLAETLPAPAQGSLVEIDPGAAVCGMLWNGTVLASPPPPAPDPAVYGAAVQAHLEATAIAQGYTSALTCVSYIDSINLTWAAEAVIFKAWRDAVWLYAYGVLADVQGGLRAPPTVEALIAELPVINWS
jgi:hypothetical protein